MSPTAPGRLPKRLGLTLALGAVATVVAYAPIFPSLVREWASFPNLSHGFAVPLIAGYLLWSRRQDLVSIDVIPSWSWLPVVLAGLVLYVAGMRGGEPFLARLSFPVTLFGTLAVLGGAEIAKQVWPGIGYLLLMIPPPWVALKSVTAHARLLDATATAAILPWLGVPVFQDGVLLHLSSVTLEVADVCSSIPAIASLLALGTAYGFVRGRSTPLRLLLILATIPLGIASNIIRIVLTAFSAHHFGPIALNNVTHLWSGTTVFLMTFGALVLLDMGLQRLLHPPSPTE